MNAIASVEPAPGRIVRAAGRDIFVAEVGEGPPLLMLHGGGPGATGVANFVRNIPALAERFRLIVPDMPGYGRSTKGLDRKDPFGDLAGAMLGLMDALGVARAHALGNSLGGACALRMALDQPARVDAVLWVRAGSTQRAACRRQASKACSTITPAKGRPAKSSRPSCGNTLSMTAPRSPTR